MKTISLYLISLSLGVGIDKHNRSLVSPISSLQTQSAVVLAISLIILLLLTLIGLSATQTTALEEKMVGNLRDKSLTFQAAESALRAAELTLNPPPTTFTAAGVDGLYLDVNSLIPNPIPTAAAILTDNFWISNPVAISTITGLGIGIDANPPLYIIQKLPTFHYLPCALPCQNFVPYKITVRATGDKTAANQAGAVVILQSIKMVPS